MQAVGYMACLVLLWIHLDDYGASEFSGGALTGPLFRMADSGGLLFLLALPLTFFLRRVAAAIGLVAGFLCLPFCLYIVMPGPYRWVFKGEYKAPLDRPFHWDAWAVLGIFSLIGAAILSIRGHSKV